MNDVLESILTAEELPSPPGIAFRLLELYSQSDVEVSEMARVISADPALTAKLIAYCNSPMLARENTCSSVQQAIVVIGMRGVKILALSFSLVRTNSTNDNKFDYDEFWNRSLAMAIVAKTFGSEAGGTGDEEFLLGIMLKIGQIGLAHTYPNKYGDLVTQSVETGESLRDLEELIWNTNHMAIGVELLKHWKFPDSLVANVQMFADSSENASITDTNVQVLKLADRVVGMLFATEVSELELQETQAMAKQWLGIDSERFGQLFDLANETWSDFAPLMKFDASQAQTFEQLENRVRKHIAQMTIGLYSENAEIRQQNAELRINAMVDSLTELKNRRAFYHEAPVEWERARRMNRPFVVMIVDIDHFKAVNDTYGHPVGDAALVSVAQALTANARKYDSVYRFGGEEFVVVLTECEPASALIAAERFRCAFEGIEVVYEGGTTNITASIGVAVMNPGELTVLDDLLEKADKLLYQAKEEGRNRVCSNVESYTK